MYALLLCLLQVPPFVTLIFYTKLFNTGFIHFCMLASGTELCHVKIDNTTNTPSKLKGNAFCVDAPALKKIKYCVHIHMYVQDNC